MVQISFIVILTPAFFYTFLNPIRLLALRNSMYFLNSKDFEACVVYYRDMVNTIIEGERIAFNEIERRKSARLKKR
jgi:hypothetical protein